MENRVKLSYYFPPCFKISIGMLSAVFLQKKIRNNFRILSVK